MEVPLVSPQASFGLLASIPVNDRVRLLLVDGGGGTNNVAAGALAGVGVDVLAAEFLVGSG